MESFNEYLGKIKFTVLNKASELTEDMLFNVDTKEGFVIEDKYDIYICRKFEPMKFLNQITIFESVNEYYIIDMFGVVMYEGEVSDVIEFVNGFFSGDEI